MKPKRRRPLKPLDRIWRGVRICLDAGVRTEAERTKRERMLLTLMDEDRWEIWQGIAEGRLTIPEVYRHSKADTLDQLSGSIALHQDMASAVETWLPKSAPAESTRNRYEVSWGSLQRFVMAKNIVMAKVKDLEAIDWRAMKAEWVGGPHDWAKLRGFVSHFLTDVLGDTYHPFRRRVMKTFPAAPKVHRVPDATPELFWRIQKRMPEHIDAVPVALVLTGMRIGELCACDETNLLPLTHQVRIPGKQMTEGYKSDDATQPVDERLWAWIERAIPVPVSHWQVRAHWRAACKAEGVPELHLHDLRHCFGQWLVNEGQTMEAVQRGLRHKTFAQTVNYVQQKERQQNAKVIAGVLIRSREKSQRRKTAGRAKGA